MRVKKKEGEFPSDEIDEEDDFLDSLELDDNDI